MLANKPLGVYERNTGDLVKELSTEDFTALATNADGTLAAAGSTTQVNVWSIATGKRVIGINEKRTRTGDVKFSSDNALILVFSNEGVGRRIDLLKLATGQIEQHAVPGIVTSHHYFCAGDGLVTWLATPAKLICWNLRDKTVRWETEHLELRCFVTAISPDGTYLLTTDHRVSTLWDCTTGEIRYQVPCMYSIAQLAFMPDGRSFVVGGTKGQLSVWNTQTGQRLFEIANLKTAIEAIRPLDTGFLVATRQKKKGRPVLTWYEF